MRALIVEDDERLRHIVRRSLTRLNLACDDAASLEEASELLDLHEYDVLVLDRRLPDGDGLALCRDAR
ncbi:MAG TPA: response regulator, partial [Thermoanaerobaculia bacterium]|nr:response regulator [Thermoanaerobaculia bacterium]